MSQIRLTILLILTLTGYLSFGQYIKPGNSFGNSFYSIIKTTDSGKHIISYYRNGCKGYFTQSEFIPNAPQILLIEKVSISTIPAKRIKFLTIHGNIYYDYFYRSAIDTPVSQRNFQQHTEKVYLNVVLKEKYPLKINFISRQSNSPYFRNFTDVNLQFDKYAYNKNLKQQVIDKLKAQVAQYTQYKYPDLTKIQTDLQKQKEQFTATQTWLEDPRTLQKIIEERERNYLTKKQKEKDSVNAVLFGKGKDKFNNSNDSLSRIKDSAQLELSRLRTTKEKISDSLLSTKARIITKKDSIADRVVNKVDSISEPYAKLYEQRKKELDSLARKIERTKKKVDSIQQVAEKGTQSLRQKIARATSEKELRKLAEENCIDVARMDKLGQKLAAIKTFSIGRSMLDYTELTAQNISITGLNVEYCMSSK